MRLFWWLLKQPVPKQIERYSRFSPSPLSIKQFLDFGECGTVWVPMVATVPMAPLAAAFRARCHCLRSPAKSWESRAGLRDVRGLSRGL